MNWGSVSDWVSGIATAVAVVVALIFSLRAERHEREQKLGAVYAWFTIQRDANAESGILWLHNATEVPIYEWRVRVEYLHNDEEVEVSTGSEDLGILPPGRFSFPLHGTHSLPSNDSAVRVKLRFRDANGRGLSRTPTGALQVARLRGGMSDD
jgi:hypothetical protein